jgi:hypothetical protein
MLFMATRTATDTTGYQHLEARPGSFYREFFVRGLNLRASRLVAWMEVEGLTPEQAAVDRDVALEAVLEAIDYVRNNSSLISQDLDREHRLLRDCGLLDAGDA